MKSIRLVSRHDCYILKTVSKSENAHTNKCCEKNYTRLPLISTLCMIFDALCVTKDKLVY